MARQFHGNVGRLDRETALDRAYPELARRYGPGAATTYYVLRSAGESVIFSLDAMRQQIATLGPHYTGINTVEFRARRSKGEPMTVAMVAEVLKVKTDDIKRATRELGNVGRKTHRQGVIYSSDDIDRIKAFLQGDRS